MGLLFNDNVGSSGPILSRLHTLMAAARCEKDIGRTLHEIKQLLAEHPELRRFATDEFKRPPCLAVDDVAGRRGRVERYRPRQSALD